ncbi:hypothetical protein LALCM10_130050 [Dellaglioa algida]|nr:hypothetical protein LALCM10_130050 [Dellaglioa algida]
MKKLINQGLINKLYPTLVKTHNLMKVGYQRPYGIHTFKIHNTNLFD